jgi:hypothetical protein
VAQVVGTRPLDTRRLGRWRVDPPAPVPVGGGGPRLAVVTREEQLVRWRPSGVLPPLGEVLRQRSDEAHRAGPAGLGPLDGAERDGALDEQRALADVRPPQGQRLAGPQPGVRQDRHERRIPDAPAAEQHEPDRLDALGRERHDRARSRRNRLAHNRGGVRREPPPLAGALRDALKQYQRLADRCRAHAVGLELEPEPVDHVRRQLAQRDRAQPRKHVCVPDRGVALEGRLGEVRLSVEPPPLLAEIGERLLAGVELRELAGALATRDLGVEGLGVALAAQDL